MHGGRLPFPRTKNAIKAVGLKAPNRNMAYVCAETIMAHASNDISYIAIHCVRRELVGTVKGQPAD